ncbi:PREDICTED: mpv17-like protein [Nicrophorus vespilloides]|uniref:Mpv17-like protein n=1 Tax=Nicrophorus vespilloides TaxID=110193 RepID=A0ABM1N271_NICVS|nr:PREDICTED: mpv17-like protein [Nicrophorus vespilloides]
MSKFAAFVKNAFTKHPVIANSVIYGTLYLGAEMSQQVMTKKVLTDKPEPMDMPTLARYGFYGTIIQGPLLTFWYKWLDAKFVGTGLKLVAKKLMVDQFVSVPPLLLIFFVSMSIMERKPNVLEEFQSKFKQTFVNSCMFWMPVQAINFTFVPAAFRVVYIGTASFAWVNILCYIKRQQY